MKKYLNGKISSIGRSGRSSTTNIRIGSSTETNTTRFLSIYFRAIRNSNKPSWRSMSLKKLRRSLWIKMMRSGEKPGESQRALRNNSTNFTSRWLRPRFKTSKWIWNSSLSMLRLSAIRKLRLSIEVTLLISRNIWRPCGKLLLMKSK